MPRKCSICIHKDRDSMDLLLVNNQSFRDIARQFQVSTMALLRHKQGHVPSLLRKSKEMAEVCRAENLLEEIKSLRNEAKRISKKAESVRDFRGALAGVRERIRIVELLSRLDGALGEQPVNGIVTPQWISIRTKILEVLEAYPEARVKIAEVLDNEPANL